MFIVLEGLSNPWALQGWQSYLNLGLTIYYHGIRDFKSLTYASVVAVFKLRGNDIKIEKCTAGPTGLHDTLTPEMVFSLTMDRVQKCVTPLSKTSDFNLRTHSLRCSNLQNLKQNKALFLISGET